MFDKDKKIQLIVFYFKEKGTFEGIFLVDSQAHYDIEPGDSKLSVRIRST